jgi:hypothetical protein
MRSCANSIERIHPTAREFEPARDMPAPDSSTRPGVSLLFVQRWAATERRQSLVFRGWAPSHIGNAIAANAGPATWSGHPLVGLLDFALLALWMVNNYGPNAPLAVDRKLAAMERRHASQSHIEIWCQIARAVLAIIDTKPRGPLSVN